MRVCALPPLRLSNLLRRLRAAHPFIRFTARMLRRSLQGRRPTADAAEGIFSRTGIGWLNNNLLNFHNSKHRENNNNHNNNNNNNNQIVCERQKSSDYYKGQMK
jgi:hypothetical protein